MKLSLTGKILSLSLLMVLLLLVLGGVGFWSVSTLVERADHANQRLGDSLDATTSVVWAIKQYQNQADLIINQELGTVKVFDESAQKFQEVFKKVQDVADTPEEKQWVDSLLAANKKFNQTFREGVVPEVEHIKKNVLQGLDDEADALIGKVQDLASKIALSLEGEFQEAVKSGDQATIIKRANDVLAAQKMVLWAVKQYQVMADTIINRSLDAVKDFDAAASQMDKFRDLVGKAVDTTEEKAWFAELVEADEGFDKLYRQKVIPEVKRVLEDRIRRFDGESDKALSVVDEMVNNLVSSFRKEAVDATQSYHATSSLAEMITIILGAGSVALGLILGFLLARSIAGPIRKVVQGLDAASDQVASASDEVSVSGQSLAEGSSEQAASIEETSSSLEELSSMTRQNADNAQQADSLMKEAGQVVNKANQSMKDLRQAMDKITSASEETQKIIKTIDEIAFQTNLLALNAAVEAARAGEAGAGFAVVADEVRNLAMRAAEAAKNTASLIEGNIKYIKDGSELVHVTDRAFDQVQQSAAKVGELVGEIAVASQEQSQGIAQINLATSEMDRITQQVAASAEEAAAAAEELSAQSLELKDMVTQLASVVEGGDTRAIPVKRRKNVKRGDPSHKLLAPPRPGNQDNAYKEF